MAKQVKCPKCATPQPLSNNCVKCGMDFRAYARKLREKRAAEAAAQGQQPTSGQPAKPAAPPRHKRKIVKCPKCATSQPLGHKCVSCGMDFDAHIAKLRARKAAAQDGQSGGPSADSFPPMAGGVTFSPGGLRPIGRLFEDAWLIYRERFVTLFFLNLLIPVFMMVPVAALALLGLTGVALGPDMAAAGVVLGASLGALIGVVLMVIPMAGAVAAIHDQSLGLKAALKVGREKLWSYLWVMGLVGFIVPVGFFLFFLPGVIFTIWFMFAKYIVIAEGGKGMSTLMKSKEYARGHWWALFGRMALIVLISAIVGTTGVGSLLFQPFMYVMFYIMYRDLRADKGDDVSYPPSGLRWILIATLGYLLLGLLMAGAVFMGGDKLSNFDPGQFKDMPSNDTGRSTGRASGDIDLSAEARITTEKDVYASGQSIGIDYSGMSGSESDWITLVDAGNSDNSYGQWFYTKGKKQGSYVFDGEEPGDYEIRVYFDYKGGGGYEVRARKRITVSGDPKGSERPKEPGGPGSPGVPGAAGDFISSEGASLLMEDTVYAPSGRAEVHYIAPGGLPDNAWVGIVPSHVPHGSESVNDKHDLAYKYLGGSTGGSLTFTVPAEPGEYDFRMNDTDSGGKELTYISFTVTGG